MSYRDKLARNIPLFYIAEFFAELLFIIPVFVAYERQFLTFGQMGILAALRFAITIILELPTGAFADLAGRKMSVALGLLLNTVGLSIQAFAPSVIPFVAGTVMRAVGDSFTSGPAVALAYDSLKELSKEKEFGKVRANVVLIVQASIMLSSVFAGYMYNVWSGLPYLATAISIFAGSMLYLFMQELTIDIEKWLNGNYVLMT